jgi:dipeptide transport system permease protein
MLRFLLNRLGLLIPTFVGVSIISFAFIRLLPGDPILLLAGEHGVSPERYAELRELYGYDRSIVVQYLD